MSTITRNHKNGCRGSTNTHSSDLRQFFSSKTHITLKKRSKGRTTGIGRVLLYYELINCLLAQGVKIVFEKIETIRWDWVYTACESQLLHFWGDNSHLYKFKSMYVYIGSVQCPVSKKIKSKVPVFN